MGSSSQRYTLEVSDPLEHGQREVGLGHHFENLTISGHARVHNGDSITYNTILPPNVTVEEEAKALSKVIKKHEEICSRLYQLLSQDTGISEYVNIKAKDTIEVSKALEILRTSLGDDLTDEAAVWAAGSENAGDIIARSGDFIEEILYPIIQFNKAQNKEAGGKEKSVMSSPLRPDQVKAFHETMMNLKVTLNTTIAITNWYKTNKTTRMLAELREQIAAFTQRLEDEKAQHLPPSQPHNFADYGKLPEDLSFAMTKFLDEGRSLQTRADPSMQLSSESWTLPSTEYQTCTGSAPTDFWTLRSHTASLFTATDRLVREPPQIRLFIAGSPVRGQKTVTMHVSRQQRISFIKEEIADLFNLTPNVDFQLMHRNRMLSTSHFTLAQYGIVDNMTLHCTSFRIGQICKLGDRACDREPVVIFRLWGSKACMHLSTSKFIKMLSKGSIRIDDLKARWVPEDPGPLSFWWNGEENFIRPNEALLLVKGDGVSGTLPTIQIVAQNIVAKGSTDIEVAQCASPSDTATVTKRSFWSKFKTSAIGQDSSTAGGVMVLGRRRRRFGYIITR